MRRLAPLLVVLALAGCGGGGRGVELADVRPCLDKLGVVLVPQPPTGVTITIDVEAAEVTYDTSQPGATAARLAFYGKAKDAKAAMEQTTTGPPIRLPGGPAQLVGNNVILTWSSPPAPAQKRKLLACFD